MSQHILHVLPCLIGNICKKAECRNIDKNILIKSTNIAAEASAIHNHSCCLFHAPRDSQTSGKVISCSCRNVADRQSFFTPHHTGHHFIKCAITTAAGNHIIVTDLSFCNCPDPIPLCLCRIGSHFISGLHKNIDHIKKITSDLGFSRSRIVNKKHFLLHKILQLPLAAFLFLSFYIFHVTKDATL